MEMLGAWDFEFKIEEILTKLKFQNIKEKAGNYLVDKLNV